MDRIAFCCDARFLSSRFKIDSTGVLATLMKISITATNQQCFEFFKLNQQVAPPQVPVASIEICLWIYSCGGPFNGCMGSRSIWYSAFGLCIDIMYVSFNDYNVTVMNIWLSLLNNMKGHIFCRPCITPVRNNIQRMIFDVHVITALYTEPIQEPHYCPQRAWQWSLDCGQW